MRRNVTILSTSLILIDPIVLTMIGCTDCHDVNQSTVTGTVNGSSGDYSVSYALEGECQVSEHEVDIVISLQNAEFRPPQYKSCSDLDLIGQICLRSYINILLPMSKISVSGGTLDVGELGPVIVSMYEEGYATAFSGDPTNETCGLFFVSEYVEGTVDVESLEPILSVTVNVRFENSLGYWREVHATCHSTIKEVCN